MNSEIKPEDNGDPPCLESTNPKRKAADKANAKSELMEQEATVWMEKFKPKDSIPQSDAEESSFAPEAVKGQGRTPPPTANEKANGGKGPTFDDLQEPKSTSQSSPQLTPDPATISERINTDSPQLPSNTTATMTSFETEARSIATPAEAKSPGTTSINIAAEESAQKATPVIVAFGKPELDSGATPEQDSPSIKSSKTAVVESITHDQYGGSEVTYPPSDIWPAANVDTAMVEFTKESKTLPNILPHDTSPVANFDCSESDLNLPLFSPAKVFRKTEIKSTTFLEGKLVEETDSISAFRGSRANSTKISEDKAYEESNKLEAEPATSFSENSHEKPAKAYQKTMEMSSLVTETAHVKDTILNSKDFDAKSAAPFEDDTGEEIDVEVSQKDNESFTAAPEDDEANAIPQKIQTKAKSALPPAAKGDSARVPKKTALKSSSPSNNDRPPEIGDSEADYVTTPPSKRVVVVVDDDVVNDIIPIDDPQQDYETNPVSKIKNTTRSTPARKSNKSKPIIVPRTVAMPPLKSGGTFIFPRFNKKGKVYIELRVGDEKYTYRLEANVLTKASKWFAGAMTQKRGEPNSKIATKWTADNGGLTSVFDMEYCPQSELWKLKRATRSIRQLEEVPKDVEKNEIGAVISAGAEVSDFGASEVLLDEYSTGFSAQSEFQVSGGQGQDSSVNSTVKELISSEETLKRPISALQDEQDDGVKKSPKRQRQDDYTVSNDVEMVNAPQTTLEDTTKTDKNNADNLPTRRKIRDEAISHPQNLTPDVDLITVSATPHSSGVEKKPECGQPTELDVIDLSLAKSKKGSSQPPGVQAMLYKDIKTSKENFTSKAISKETVDDCEITSTRECNGRNDTFTSRKGSAVSAQEGEIDDDVISAQRGPPDHSLEGFDNLFRIYHNLPVIISTDCLELALNQVELLFNMATLYGLPSDRRVGIRRDLGQRLIKFNDTALSIRRFPWRWLYLSMFLRCALIFKEAVIHVAGQQSHHPLVMPSYVSVTGDVELLIARKVEELSARKEIANTALLNLSVLVGGVDVREIRRGVEYDAHHYWHDWYKKEIEKACVDRENGSNTDALAYRILARGKDRYLREDEVLADYKKHLSGHGAQLNDIDETRFKSHLSAMKESAGKFVEDLVQNQSAIKKMGYIPYLTCTTVTDDELPWKRKDYHPYFSSEGDDYELNRA